jgi:hypothetical protein
MDLTGSEEDVNLVHTEHCHKKSAERFMFGACSDWVFYP